MGEHMKFKACTVLRICTIACMAALFCVIACEEKTASAEGIITVTGECVEAGRPSFDIVVPDSLLEGTEYIDGIDGIDVYRADAPDGEYVYVGEEPIKNYDEYSGYYIYNTYESYNGTKTFTFEEPSYLATYRYYYYYFKPYVLEEGAYDYENDVYVMQKSYIESTSAGVSIYVLGVGPDIKYGKRKGKTSAKIKWKKVDDADGYLIYCVSDTDKKGNVTYPDIGDENSYKLVKKISGNDTCSATFKNLKYSVTYTYRVYCYKKIDGTLVRSLSSDIVDVPMDYYGYASELYDEKVKRAYGSEKKKKKNYSSEAKADRQMKTIKIKVWDFQNGKNGKKVTKTKYLTVNRNLAPTIQRIFQEIYKSKQKQVIHDVGSYNYRSGQHMYGLAIDVNANENYMVEDKKALAGSFWKPGKNPYSIPKECDFVRIMERYGFRRGLWGTRKDYMHFSYFGS